MAKRPIPVPQTTRPLSPVDPYRDRVAYRRLLSELYHAEQAALDGFRLLSDPNFVHDSEMFRNAARMLIRDEEQHLRDLEAMIEVLGGPPGVAPPHPKCAEFWSYWRTGRVFAFPLPASVAALFCLLGEGLGYAFLYHLAAQTTDPTLAASLWRNIEDEQRHLWLSMSILRRALANDPDFVADMLVYGLAYGLLARTPVRYQRAVAEDVGLDFDLVTGSSLRFVADLLRMVFEDSGYRRGAQVLAALPEALWSPTATRAFYLSTFIPIPRLWERASLSWGNYRARRVPHPTATAAQTFELPRRERRVA